MPFKKHSRSIGSLLETMQILRSPKGCPWDAEQTPQSLTPYIMEEACELIDAIETGTDEMIKEELGDLLLQVIFQAQIFAEQGKFNFDDIADTINDKLLRRHPHVFSSNDPNLNNHQLDQQWEEIKQAEKRLTNRRTCLADHLPNRLPALQRAQKLVSRLHKTGLSRYLRETDVVTSPRSSSDRVASTTQAISSESELGYHLFHLVIKAEKAGFDAERALRQVIQKVVKKVPPGRR
jgi:MazG family protein